MHVGAHPHFNRYASPMFVNFSSVLVLSDSVVVQLVKVTAGAGVSDDTCAVYRSLYL
jgi:hypothetical protein